MMTIKPEILERVAQGVLNAYMLPEEFVEGERYICTLNYVDMCEDSEIIVDIPRIIFDRYSQIQYWLENGDVMWSIVRK